MKKLMTTLCAVAGLMTITHAQTALDFNASNNVVDIGATLTNDLAGSTSLTVEAWVNSSTTTGLGAVVGNYNYPTQSSQMQFLIRRDNDQYNFFISDGTTFHNVLSGAGTVVTGQWQHVVGTWDGSELKIYIDGIEMNSNPSAPGPLPSTINEVAIGNNGMGEEFTGQIDNVRIWSSTRSASEIVESMNQCLNGSETDLLAMYTFEDGTGSMVLTDETGNGYDGTLVNMDPNSNWVTSLGGPQMVLDQSLSAASTTICPNTSTTIDIPNTQEGVLYYLRNDNGDSIVSGPEMGSGSISLPTGNLSSTTTFNVYGSYRDNITALSFDGNDDIVTIGNNLSTDLVGLNTITVEAWVKPATDAPGNYNVFGNYSYPGNNNSMQLLIRQEGSAYTFFLDDGNGYQSVSTGTGYVTVGQWQHVVGVWDGSATRILVDGVEIASNNSLTGAGLPTTSNEYYIGNNDINESFEGDVDKIRVWNYVRTTAEINATDSVCLQGTENGLLALYGMENGPGNTMLTDQTGNGYVGTLLNMDPETDWVRGVDCSACGGQMTSTVTVTAEDVTAPILSSMPSDITTAVNTTNCEATVTWTAPTATDNCVTPTVTSTHNSGDNFPVGTTTVSYTVTDGEGNSVTETFDVVVTSDLAATSIVLSPYNGQEISCNGASDGEASVTPAGGNSPYTYLWSDNQTTSTATGLAAGAYSVVVTDANGCTVTENITITEPDPLVGTTATTDVTCNGDTDGEVTLSITGGTTSYSFVWDDASNSTTQDLSGVGAGTYNVDVTDANGCTATASATVNEPTALSGTANTTAETNGNDGSIDLTPTGGTSPYSYSWTGPNGFTSTDQNPTGLEGGIYEVTITDDNGCTFTFEVTVESFVGLEENEANNFTIYPNPTNGTFNIESSERGTVEIFNTNGKVVYTTTIDYGKTQLQVSDLALGVYTIRLSSGNSFQFKKLVIR